MDFDDPVLSDSNPPSSADGSALPPVSRPDPYYDAAGVYRQLEEEDFGLVASLEIIERALRRAALRDGPPGEPPDAQPLADEVGRALIELEEWAVESFVGESDRIARRKRNAWIVATALRAIDGRGTATP